MTDDPHVCGFCGATGPGSAASAIQAFCNSCDATVAIDNDSCPCCGEDALILGCGECGGPWRNDDPNPDCVSLPPRAEDAW